MSALAERSPRDVVAAVPTQLLIGGAWVDPTTPRTFAVEDPATGERLALVADADARDADRALAAASAAAGPWAATAPRERAELLQRAFALTRERREELALLITLEMGKPLHEARGEVDYGAEYLRWFAEQAVRIDGRVAHAPDGRGELLVTREPVGPCLLITPWNFPLAMATRKLAPALAAGCTAILKPAAETPLTALAFAAILCECGLPPGVVNVITTAQAGPTVGPLLGDRRLRKLSFTGSTAVGRRLVRDAADQLLRVSMELGGNAPFLVLEDADLDLALDAAMVAKMRNGGEACTAANRFLVHRSLADPFAHGLAGRMAALRVGHGTASGVAVGPLIHARQRAKVDELVRDALARGATLLTGGAPLDGAGAFYPPTVLNDVPHDARLLHEETFGPVAPIVPFDDERDAIRRANDTEYGLVAYVISSDLAHALRVARQLDTGMVGVNQGVVSNAAAPFGGVKASGLGREGGVEGIDEYLETRYAAFALPAWPGGRGPEHTPRCST
jgi:succinate-semialdehyde dehydrogenase/glutarate-semialdehyde dehydrogenase